MKSIADSNHSLVWGYFLGVITTTIVYNFYNYTIGRTKSDETTKDRTHAGAIIEGNDLSLYYSNDITQLKTITSDQKFLPKDIYKEIVLNTVVCCVDVLLVDTSTMKCLLVLRNSEPAKNLWWLPGGRLYKGETFYDAAIRKVKEETGIDYEHNEYCTIEPIQILGIWNTFFPTSHWDTDTRKGTQTVNPIVLVEMKPKKATSLSSLSSSLVKLDETSSQYRWITLDPLLNQNEDKYVLQALYRLRSWNSNYIQYQKE